MTTATWSFAQFVTKTIHVTVHHMTNWLQRPRDCDFLSLGQYTFFPLLKAFFAVQGLHRSENTCSNLCGKAFLDYPKSDITQI